MSTVTGKTRRGAPAASGNLAGSGLASANGTIKLIPASRSQRDRLRRLAAEAAARLDAGNPLERGDLERAAREILSTARQPAGYLGWTMVALASAYWRGQLQAVAPSRRLLLLPDDLPSQPARDVEQRRRRAMELGYQVLPVNDSPAVLRLVESGAVDGIVGLATLDVLEMALEPILWFGIPCMATPLLGAATDAADATVAAWFDADCLDDMIELPHAADSSVAPNYLHLLRTARQMFEPGELAALAPPARQSSVGLSPHYKAGTLDPIAGTEAIAYDFLGKGGKYSRPFITLAVYDAMTGGRGAQPGGHRHVAQLPLAVKRAAMSIETFHKASLVHDDIEDDDPFRYGEPTLHRRFGVPVAINVGDYLIGLGYRLVSRESAALGAATVCDILDRLADAHMKLSEGQGAELLWRDSRDKQLAPADALQIYALKSAPAFEAALLTGLRLAGPAERYLQAIVAYSRALGVAFQILNDLADWQPDRHNKLIAAGDVVGGRPTVLWALALEGLSAAGRSELQRLAGAIPAAEETIRQIRRLYREANVFDKAEQFIGEYREAARQVAAAQEPPELRRLLLHLIELVLKRPALPVDQS